MERSVAMSGSKQLLVEVHELRGGSQAKRAAIGPSCDFTWRQTNIDAFDVKNVSALTVLSFLRMPAPLTSS